MMTLLEAVEEAASDQNVREGSRLLCKTIARATTSFMSSPGGRGGGDFEYISKLIYFIRTTAAPCVCSLHTDISPTCGACVCDGRQAIDPPQYVWYSSLKLMGRQNREPVTYKCDQSSESGSGGEWNHSEYLGLLRARGACKHSNLVLEKGIVKLFAPWRDCSAFSAGAAHASRKDVK